MRFIETPTFTKLVNEILSDDSYSELQAVLAKDPAKGDVIPGGKGLRKIRWSVPGKGKRGGLRVIYYWISADNIIYMVTLYKKSQKDDMSREQLKILAEYAKKYLT
jgi:hypothetical protein